MSRAALIESPPCGRIQPLKHLAIPNQIDRRGRVACQGQVTEGTSSQNCGRCRIDCIEKSLLRRTADFS